MITRLRLDAALYEPAPSRLPGTMGRPRLKGKSAPPRLGFPQGAIRFYETLIKGGM